MNILVVDDNRATRKVVRFALERRGHRVMEAASAASATGSIAEVAPDLILQDLSLPDVDSFDFVQSLRSLTGGAIPIVAFSGDIGSIAFLRSAGFDGAIVKPVQPTQLVEQVESLLLRKRARDSAASPQAVARTSMFAAAPQQLAQRCAELASQLAIVEGMTAAVLEEPNVDSLFGELLTAWFNAGGLGGGALYLRQADGLADVRCVGAWKKYQGAAETLIASDARFRTAMESGQELRLSGSDAIIREQPFCADTQEILFTPVRCGESIFGTLVAASNGPSWTAWESLTRSVAQRIAQLCLHQQMQKEQEIIAAAGRRQAALMTALVDNAPDVIAHLDREGRIEFVNRAMTKNPNVRLIGASILDFVRPAERERVRGILVRVVETGETVTYELEATGTDDAPSWWSCRMGPVRQRGEVVGVVLVCRDISVQRSIEARLRVADRLAAIGTLAAGVAHEINTPIQYVANNLDFVLACVKAITGTGAERGMSREFALERLPTALADCGEGIKRVAAITHAMRTFSHPGTRYDQVDVNECLRATVELTRHQWKDHAEVETELDPELFEITGSRAELNQLFLNLVINAGHAIEDAQKDGPRPGKIRITSSVEGDRDVVIKIADNGCGIPAAAQSRVYDLFFTTKEVGRGSGQGLALAHSIVTSHGGSISFETEEGQGTTFTLRLPIESDISTGELPS